MYSKISKKFSYKYFQILRLMSDQKDYLEFERRDMVVKTQRLNSKLNHEISKNQDYEQKIKILGLCQTSINNLI